MSLRIAASKAAISRNTNLPSMNVYTVVMAVKLATTKAGHDGHLFYLQDTGGNHAQALVVNGSNNAFAANSFFSSVSASVATLSPGGAEDTNWSGLALRSEGTGSGLLDALFKPIGSGTIAKQETNCSPLGSDTATIMIIGEAPFNPGDFGTTDWWPDAYIAHLKIYSAALSDAEIAAEIDSPTPVRTANLISYHAFTDMTLSNALVPQQGSGTFTAYNSNPSMSTDNPNYTQSVTLTLADELPTTGVSTGGGGTVGQRPSAPTLSSAVVSGARRIDVTVTHNGTIPATQGYRIYAQRTGQPSFVAASIPAGATSGVAVGLDPAVGYTLWATALNDVGESDASASVSRTTLKVKVRMTKVENIIANVSGITMMCWLAPTTLGKRIGTEVGELGNITAGPAVFDATEGVTVCTVDGNYSTHPSVGMLAAGASVRACLVKDADNRFTAIVPATVVEEA